MDYKIRRGRRGEGHDAISDADRYEGPICTGICTAGGAPGPGGAGRRLLPPTVLKYFVVNRTKKDSCHILLNEQNYMRNLVKVLCTRTKRR